jgi:hypothetical protein
MSTRGSIYYKDPIYIYHEMNDGWIYFTLDTTPSILFPLCRAEFYFKIKRANKACTGRFAAWLRGVQRLLGSRQ